jgi:hypothetical protein
MDGSKTLYRLAKWLRLEAVTMVMFMRLVSEVLHVPVHIRKSRSAASGDSLVCQKLSGTANEGYGFEDQAYWTNQGRSRPWEQTQPQGLLNKHPLAPRTGT